MKSRGQNITLDPHATQGFSLIIHELCTNAHKYGAFSTADGRVTISWTIDSEEDQAVLQFTWREHGGSPVVAPERKSFGTMLLQSAISGQHSAQIDYATDGLIYRLQTPLAVIATEIWLQQQREPRP